MKMNSVYSLAILLGSVMFTQNMYAMEVKLSNGSAVASAGMQALAQGMHVLGIGIAVAGIAVGIGIAIGGKYLGKK